MPKKKPAIRGKGTVTPPAGPVRASYDFHYKEFLSRGLSKAESDRLAKAVVARDEQAHQVPPLELSE